ncbi:MAG: chaperone modulator CbpM [Hyphomicrobium sp.]|jgi:chaperone modulatory protein CbpM
MPTEKPQTQSVQILEECEEITLVELSRICRVHTEWVVELIQEGVVEPLPAQGTQWRFSATSIVRVQKANRLQRDLGVNLAGTALVLDLLDKIEALEARLRGIAEASAPEDADTD